MSDTTFPKKTARGLSLRFRLVHMLKPIRQLYVQAGIEPFIWAAALVYLAVTQPQDHPGLTLCPLAHLGIPYCPGCGLGRAVSYALHGQFVQSFHAHIAGIPAILIMSFRILSVVRGTYRNHSGSTTPHEQQRSTHAQRNAVNADSRER